MTNEKIAALIGEGGNDELLPLLWDKMRRYYRMAATKYAAGHAERCARCGVTYEDIMQESYFSMLEAVKGYNARKPEQAALHFYIVLRLSVQEPRRCSYWHTYKSSTRKTS